MNWYHRKVEKPNLRVFKVGDFPRNGPSRFEMFMYLSLMALINLSYMEKLCTKLLLVTLRKPSYGSRFLIKKALVLNNG